METQAINIRLPVDVLNFFKDNYSPGYQTKIKEILHSYMEENS